MPAASSKADLLTVTVAEYDKLQKLLDGIGAERAATRGAEGISVKDTIAHRTHWIRLFIGWYRDGVNGLEVHTPAPGYKWSDLKAYNEGVRRDASDLSWEDVRRNFAVAHQELVGLLEGLSEETLYTQGLYPWMNKWTLGRWAEASGASHSRSAAKFIRALLKEPTVAH